jgi:hypothetical protein
MKPLFGSSTASSFLKALTLIILTGALSHLHFFAHPLNKSKKLNNFIKKPLTCLKIQTPIIKYSAFNFTETCSKKLIKDKKKEKTLLHKPTLLLKNYPTGAINLYISVYLKWSCEDKKRKKKRIFLRKKISFFFKITKKFTFLLCGFFLLFGTYVYLCFIYSTK